MGLCVLSTGTFGYFGLRMVTPSPAAAATRPVLKPSEPAAAAKAADAPAGTVAAPAADAVAPPPTPGMRDPFVVGYTAPKTAPAGTPPAFTTPPHGSASAVATPMNGTQMADTQIHEQVSALPPAPVSNLAMPGFPAAPPLPPAAPALPPQKVMPLPAPPRPRRSGASPACCKARTARESPFCAMERAAASFMSEILWTACSASPVSPARRWFCGTAPHSTRCPWLEIRSAGCATSPAFARCPRPAGTRDARPH